MERVFSLLIFDERYPSIPGDLRDPSAAFTVIPQWYELAWDNEIDTREEIFSRIERQGLRVANERTLSRFYVVTAARK
jgi:hypothetical protein